MLKSIKVLVLSIAMMCLTTIAVFADSKTIGHNRLGSLQYGTFETYCSDTSTSHFYSISGNASSRSARLYVYIKNSSGATVASDTSTSYTTFAIANWTRSYKTTHSHGATSALVE